MNDLLKLTIEAHGGLDRWRDFDHISCRLIAGGVLWEIKKQQGVLDDIYATVDTKKQFTSHYPFINQHWRTSVQANRVAIEDENGGVVEELLNPRSSFIGHVVETPWTRLQLAYFVGYAMWTYFNAPFHFGDPGYKVQELEPWNENGQHFRRLQVTYPQGIATHGPVQVFYIDQLGLIRRHDYDVDISGSSQASHYSFDYVEVQGIKIATKRTVYIRNADNSSLQPDPLLVSMILSEFKLG